MGLWMWLTSQQHSQETVVPAGQPLLALLVVNSKPNAWLCLSLKMSIAVFCHHGVLICIVTACLAITSLLGYCCMACQSSRQPDTETEPSINCLNTLAQYRTVTCARRGTGQVQGILPVTSRDPESRQND
jgi:hypothetical protein